MQSKDDLGGLLWRKDEVAFDDTFEKELYDVNGAELFHLLELTQKSWNESEFNQCQVLSNDARELSWEMLHMGTWKSVDQVWRIAYGWSCLFLASCDYIECKYESALKALDMGLLMAGPNSLPQLHLGVDRIQEKLRTQMQQKEHSRKRPRDVAAQDPIPLSFESKNIPRVPLLSLDKFFKDHMLPGVPVIITGAMDHWPAMGLDDPKRAWRDFDNLRAVAGNRTVPVEVGSHYLADNWGQSLMRFDEFLDQYICGDNGKTGYLAQHQLFDQITELRRDIVISDYCVLTDNSNCPKTTDVIVNAWFGPAGTVSPLHHDPYHNLLCQVVGVKYIRLYAPSQTGNLYPVEGMLSNTSQVEVENVNKQEYPLFETAEYSECLLAEGEM